MQSKLDSNCNRNFMNNLIPKDFDYAKYLKNYRLNILLGEEKTPLNPSLKDIKPVNFSVDINNKDPFPCEYDDLTRLHYICIKRKVTTILEFGLGKSTVIFGNALKINKKKSL